MTWRAGLSCGITLLSKTPQYFQKIQIFLRAFLRGTLACSLQLVWEVEIIYKHITGCVRQLSPAFCAHRPRDHADRSVQPLHKQQLRGSSHPGPFLCSHPVRICLLPLQAQVSSRIDPSEKSMQPALWNIKAGLCHHQVQWGCRKH